jgi:hypothetical protein
MIKPASKGASAVVGEFKLKVEIAHRPPSRYVARLDAPKLPANQAKLLDDED